MFRTPFLLSTLSMLGSIAMAQSVTLDASFADGGVRLVDSGTEATVNCMTTTPDGDILCSGWTGEMGYALYRFTPDGAVDPAFGTNGVFILPDTLVVKGLAIAPDGRIILIGNLGAAIDPAFVARMLPDGGLDPSFGAGGVTSFEDFELMNLFARLVVGSEGTITIAGSGASFGQPWTGIVVRYGPDGLLDADFGSNGKVFVELPEIGVEFTSLVEDADGRWIIGGNADPQSFDTPGLMVVRLLADGSFDPAFADDGTTIISHADADHVQCRVAMDPEGRIMVHGATDLGIGGGSMRALVAARLEADGQQDPSYGYLGWTVLETGLEGAFTLHEFLVVSGEGTLALVSHNVLQNDTPMRSTALVRLGVDGDPVPGFGTESVLQVDMIDADSRLFRNMAWHGTNGLVLSGFRRDNTFPEYFQEAIIIRLGVSLLGVEEGSNAWLRPACGTLRSGWNRLSLPVADGTAVRMSLFDGGGREVQLSPSTSLMQGEAMHIQLPTNLVDGIYLLQVTSEQGHIALRCLVE